MQVSLAFGEVIRKWRMARRLTQAELAEACALDRTFISLLERGQRQPSLLSIFALARALRTPPAELVRQTERALKNSVLRMGPRAPSRKL